jgi:8-oxo-dGTP pyrophosphatase MutT (NUDIX family)
MNYTLIVVLDQSRQRALLLRKNKGPWPGKLNFPGGKLEQGESYMAGAARELYEETGIYRTELRPLVTEIFPAGNILHVFYVVLDEHEDFMQLETEPLQWYPITQLRRADDEDLCGEGNIPYFIQATLLALEA